MPSLTAAQLAQWLVEHIAASRSLPRSALDRGERFTRYGLDSLGAARMIAELGGLLGRALSPALVWEHPTIDALAAHLAGDETRTAAPPAAKRAGTNDDEPIAVIGMACRFPGAPDVPSFWRLLLEGRSAVGTVPQGRWDERVLAGAAAGSEERERVRRGAFVERIDGFDPLFFGISPREAAAMDPQQRLLLELTWEALDDAGARPGSLAGSSTAVIMGAIWSDYAALMAKGGPAGIDRYTVTGTHHSILANRISYVLGLHGPSFAVDSACSSGLVVVHLAIQSLLRGESSLAVAGAVNLDILAESALGVSRFGALSGDGACYTFDARANGYVRGEGGGVVLLKRLSRAVQDGDPVYCVIRGSAVNNDGASNGLTAPNPRAQQAVLRAAYERAGVDPRAVQYVEAHGTGTPLGDPIEARALGAVLGRERSARDPLLVGSAKTNMGHLEGAAGTVGLMKIALAVRHRLLPPSLNYTSPNPHVDLDALHLRVVADLQPWPAPERRLVAGTSSFGLGGTNGHVVVEEWPAPPVEALVLGAGTEADLRRAAESACQSLAAEAGKLPLREVCARAASHRSAGAHRAVVVARSHAELSRSLERWMAGEPGASVHRTEGADRSPEYEESTPSPGPVFVFPGQGAQWHGMALSLLQGEPVTRQVLLRCDEAVRRELGWSLVHELTAPRSASRLDDIEVSLPAIIAIDMAVAAWWRSMGVEPAAVVGHSTGEIAAAHVAGALDLDDTMKVICAYGRLIGRLSNRGGMALVGLGWDETREAIAGYEGRVFAAIEDSAFATVVAGVPAALDELVPALAVRGLFCRRVAMNVSPHCPLVDGLRDELFEALRGIRPRACSVPLISEVTGAEVPGESLGAAHWVKNFGDPARFSRAVDELIRRGHRLFLDVGPHPLTKHSVETNLRRAQVSGRVLASLRRDEDERSTLVDSLAALDVLGLPVRWGELYPEAQAPDAPAGPCVLPLSARSPEALLAMARSWGDSLRNDTSIHLRDVLYTASVRRDHHRHRLAVVGDSREELSSALSAVGRGESVEQAARGETSMSGRPRVVLVVPGQGSQWEGMGRQLFAGEPVFREALEACDAALVRESGFSVLGELRAGSGASRLGEIGVVQPVLFAMAVGLGALWRSWGVVPDVVVGHSMGEVAAAHLAGILSLEDAAKVICRRSKLLSRRRGRGAMAQVELPAPEAEVLLRGRESRLSVAVINGPRSTVLSGEPEALEEVLSSLERQGVFCRRVKVDVASHSPQMDELSPELLSLLSEVKPQRAQVPMVSTVTGEPVTGPELTAEYWVQNLRRPVLFSSAMKRILGESPSLFVELSPHPLLLPSILENLSEVGREGAALASTRRERDERRSLRESLSELYVRGVDVDWARVSPGGRVVSLPAYPWDRAPCWFEPPARAKPAEGQLRPMLDRAVTSSLHPGERLFEVTVRAGDGEYLSDHRVQGQVVFPGAGYLEMALEAAAELHGEPGARLLDIHFERMLAPGEQPCRLQLSLFRKGQGESAIAVSSQIEGHADWTRHASMVLVPAGTGGGEGEAADLGRIQARCPELVEGSAFYAGARACGLEYGPLFQGIERVFLGPGEALGRVRLPDGLETGGHVLHPAFLDACLQVTIALLPAPETTFVPVRAAHLRVWRPAPRRTWAHLSRWTSTPDGGCDVDVHILDDEGRRIAEIAGLRMMPLPRSSSRLTPADTGVHTVAWRPSASPPPAAGELDGTWVIFSDQGRWAERLTGNLQLAGGSPIVVVRGPAHRRLGPARHELDVTRPGEVERFLKDVLGKERKVRGVVHCGGLDARPWEKLDEDTALGDLKDGTFAALLIAQALVRAGARDIPPLFVVTRGAQAVTPEDRVSPAATALWGFLKTAALEHPALENRRIDLPPCPLSDEVDRVVRELAARDGEDQIALRASGRHVARLVPSELGAATLRAEAMGPARGRAFRLETQEPGTLERLSLVEIERRSPGPGEVEIEVQAAGLNFLDVLLALGALGIADRSDDGASSLGWECAGRVVSLGQGVEGLREEQEVIAVAPHAMGSHIVARRELVVDKPPSLSWEQAASLPIAFMTAHHALAHVARLGRGERVLVHSASGGVGLAALQWALRAGAEVLATAGSDEKRHLLRTLGVRHVFDSRSSSFVEDVRRVTAGEGVDVVLNSLSGELLPASFDLLREHGRFIELGKRDYLENRPLGLRPFLRNLTFSLVDLRGMILRRPAAVGRLLEEVMAHFADGTYGPVPVTAFPAARAAEAFSLMAQARHTGKVALTLREPRTPIARRPAHIRSDRTYLITGGLGGLGLSLAGWMVGEGARHLVLVGRRPPSDEARQAISAMETRGARIAALPGDVSRSDDVRRIFHEIRGTSPPVAGIVHAAGLLEDRTLLEIGERQFWAPIAPKVHGALHLLAASRDLPLDFLLLYSSVAAVLGSPGQAAYAGANAFLDGLAHACAADGLPVTSVQWGLFAEVGLAAAAANRGDRLAAQGLSPLTPREGAAFFGRVLAEPARNIGFFRFSARRWLEATPQAAGLPFFTEVRDEKAAEATERGFLRALAEAAPGERAGVMEQHVTGQLGRVVRMDPARIDPRAPFTSFGLDSLASLELRNRLEASLGLRLSAALLFTYSTPIALAGYLLHSLALGPTKVAELSPVATWTEAAAGPEAFADPGAAVGPELSADDALALEQLQDLEEYLR